MNRKFFLHTTSGIISGLCIPGISVRSSIKLNDKSTHKLDESYLIKGLMAMTRSKGWFDAHWGASIISGYYLCTENKMSTSVFLRVKKQLDTIIRMNKNKFKLPNNELKNLKTKKSLINELKKTMIGGLRAHGHATIFVSLALKAIEDVPKMMREDVINALIQICRSISTKPPIKIKSEKIERYKNDKEMVESTFSNICKYKLFLGDLTFKRPNYTHIVTHTDALVNLRKMGYEELFHYGQLAYNVHLDNKIPEKLNVQKKKITLGGNNLDVVMNKNYWNYENENMWKQKWDVNNNPNGDWVAAGHLFKVLSSYHRLIKLMNDKEKVGICSQVLLERYLNPKVKGG